MEYQLANQINSILSVLNIARNELRTFRRGSDLSKNDISEDFFQNIIKLEKELQNKNSTITKINDLKTKHPDIITKLIERCQYIKIIYKNKKETNKLVSISN